MATIKQKVLQDLLVGMLKDPTVLQNTTICGISLDSRQVQEGWLFLSLAKDIEQHLICSKNDFYFMFTILRLIHTVPKIKAMVEHMVPVQSFKTLVYLLNKLFMTEGPNYIENNIYDENKFNQIVTLLMSFLVLYMSNFGLVIQENKEPRRLKNVNVSIKI